MSLATWVFAALEKVNVQQAGDFLMPYTVLLEAGKLQMAYHLVCTESASSVKRSTDNNVHLTNSIWKHEYDLSMSVVLQGLGLREELVDLHEPQPRRNRTIRAMFVERLMPAASFIRESHSLLSVEYLTATQTHNVLMRGASHRFPLVTGDDTKEGLLLHLKETKQVLKEEVHTGRSGMLQAFPSVHQNDYCSTAVLLRWERHEPTTLIIPESEADRKRVSCELEARRCHTPFHDPLAFPYQRAVTVDGLSSLSAPHPIDDGLCKRILKAAQVILSYMNGDAQLLVKAVLMFRVMQDGTLYFLYPPFAHLRGDIERPPLAFSVPSQYRHAEGSKARPRSEHIYEEDNIEDVVIPGGMPASPGRKRRGGARKPQRVSAAVAEQRAQQEVLDRLLLRGDHNFTQPHAKHGATSQPRALCTPQPKKGSSFDQDDDESRHQQYAALFALVSADPVLPSHEDVEDRGRSSAPLQQQRRSPPPNKRSLSVLQRQAMSVNDPAVVRLQFARAALQMLEGERPVQDSVLEALQLSRKQRRQLRLVHEDASSSSMISHGGGSDQATAKRRHGGGGGVSTGFDNAPLRSKGKTCIYDRSGSDKPSVKNSIVPLQRRSTPTFFGMRSSSPSVERRHRQSEDGRRPPPGKGTPQQRRQGPTDGDAPQNGAEGPTSGRASPAFLPHARGSGDEEESALLVRPSGSQGGRSVAEQSGEGPAPTTNTTTTTTARVGESHDHGERSLPLLDHNNSNKVPRQPHEVLRAILASGMPSHDSRLTPKQNTTTTTTRNQKLDDVVRELETTSSLRERAECILNDPRRVLADEVYRNLTWEPLRQSCRKILDYAEGLAYHIQDTLFVATAAAAAAAAAGGGDSHYRELEEDTTVDQFSYLFSFVLSQYEVEDDEQGTPQNDNSNSCVRHCAVSLEREFVRQVLCKIPHVHLISVDDSMRPQPGRSTKRPSSIPITLLRQLVGSSSNKDGAPAIPLLTTEVLFSGALLPSTGEAQQQRLVLREGDDGSHPPTLQLEVFRTTSEAPLQQEEEAAKVSDRNAKVPIAVFGCLAGGEGPPCLEIQRRADRWIREVLCLRVAEAYCTDEL